MLSLRLITPELKALISTLADPKNTLDPKGPSLPILGFTAKTKPFAIGHYTQGV